jgi:hypothetical protein
MYLWMDLTVPFLFACVFRISQLRRIFWLLALSLCFAALTCSTTYLRAFVHRSRWAPRWADRSTCGSCRVGHWRAPKSSIIHRRRPISWDASWTNTGGRFTWTTPWSAAPSSTWMPWSGCGRYVAFFFGVLKFVVVRALPDTFGGRRRTGCTRMRACRVLWNVFSFRRVLACLTGRFCVLLFVSLLPFHSQQRPWIFFVVKNVRRCIYIHSTYTRNKD